MCPKSLRFTMCNFFAWCIHTLSERTHRSIPPARRPPDIPLSTSPLDMLRARIHKPWGTTSGTNQVPGDPLDPRSPRLVAAPPPRISGPTSPASDHGTPYLGRHWHTIAPGQSACGPLACGVKRSTGCTCSEEAARCEPSENTARAGCGR